eukprot:15077117-Heterocapsa_arctica.AAC.1
MSPAHVHLGIFTIAMPANANLPDTAPQVHRSFTQSPNGVFSIQCLAGTPNLPKTQLVGQRIFMLKFKTRKLVIHP